MCRSPSQARTGSRCGLPCATGSCRREAVADRGRFARRPTSTRSTIGTGARCSPITGTELRRFTERRVPRHPGCGLLARLPGRRPRAGGRLLPPGCGNHPPTAEPPDALSSRSAPRPPSLRSSPPARPAPPPHRRSARRDTRRLPPPPNRPASVTTFALPARQSVPPAAVTPASPLSAPRIRRAVTRRLGGRRSASLKSTPSAARAAALAARRGGSCWSRSGRRPLTSPFAPVRPGRGADAESRAPRLLKARHNPTAS